MEIEVKHELWKRGVLSWKLHDAQKKIYKSLTNNTEKLYVANCSRRFGKSYLMVLFAIERCINNPNHKVRYGAAFQTDLEEFIRPAFDLILEDCPEHLKPVYKSQKAKYIFPNGSEIKLFGVDKNSNAARGSGLDLIILDEAAFVDKLKYVITSVIYPAMKGREGARLILISTPPVSPDHDFKGFCEEAEASGSFSEFTIYDNPRMSEKDIQESIKECGGEDSTEFKREYLCQFVTEEERAIVPEWNDTYIFKGSLRDEYFQYYEKIVAVDTGFNDKTVLLYGYYDFQNARVVIEAESVLIGHTVTAENVYNEYSSTIEKLGYKDIKHRADSNDKIFWNDFGSKYGVYFNSTSKDSLNAMVSKLRTMVGSARVYVSEACTELTGCLKNGIWNKNRSAFDRSKTFGHYDALAALIYSGM